MQGRPMAESMGKLARKSTRSNSKSNVAMAAKFSDCHLMVQGQELPTSHWLLAQHSTVLDNLLSSTDATSLSLDGENTEVIKRLLHQLCPAHVKDTAVGSISAAEELLELARKYDIALVFERCNDYLAGTLWPVVNDTSAAVRVLVLAEAYDMTSLRAQAIKSLSYCTYDLKKKDLVQCRADSIFDILHPNLVRLHGQPMEHDAQTSCPPETRIAAEVVGKDRLLKDRIQKWSDLQLVVKDRHFAASRWILAAHSSVLRKLLATMQGNELNLDEDPDDVEKLLQHLCPTQLTLTRFTSMEEAEKLLMLARKYDVCLLFERCEGHIMEWISGQNPADAMRAAVLADLHNIPRLRTKAIAILQSVHPARLAKGPLCKCHPDTVFDVLHAPLVKRARCS